MSYIDRLPLEDPSLAPLFALPQAGRAPIPPAVFPRGEYALDLFTEQVIDHLATRDIRQLLAQNPQVDDLVLAWVLGRCLPWAFEKIVRAPDLDIPDSWYELRDKGEHLLKHWRPRTLSEAVLIQDAFVSQDDYNYDAVLGIPEHLLSFLAELKMDDDGLDAPLDFTAYFNAMNAVPEGPAFYDFTEEYENGD